jgi:glutamate dehydrogenase
MASSEGVRAVDQLTQAWEDRVESVLSQLLTSRKGRTIARRWAPRLPTIYRAGVAPESAARDVLALDRLESDDDRLVITTKNEPAPGGEGPGITRVVFARGGPRVELAQAMPILSDLGLRVIEERTARLGGEGEFWIQDFGVLTHDGEPLDLDRVGARIEACIDAIWEGMAESDSLNRLITCTSLGHERLEPLRAYRRYRQRIGSRYTEAFQSDVIVEHHAITEKLVELFELRFGAEDPAAERDVAAEDALRDEILEQIDAVTSLDHDRILRNQLQLIDATYRTNAYRPGRRALALKLRSADVPAIPQPTPLWETYVHGLRVEGVHLRAGMIARGGIRWSERMDYRTEVLGLMRAQTVKNALIVPTGAKGGFVLRGYAPTGDPVARREAVQSGYEEFITALLDVADDLDHGKVVHPDGVRVLDDEDTYLVVAADKGTATFSDVANRIAVDRGYWLGDAFASGGAEGYDHKALGITARGAWESVKRHFLDLGTDPESEPISVVGIGDMSGDVFGNGMLRSKTIRVIAAYDHRHVFVDPRPRDPEASWKERQRLFRKAGSSWDDYDRDLISPGGGVFSRTDKYVRITKAMAKALGIEAQRLSPAELIQAVLRAPVDLLWNGGIGTVVKASHERDADAEDRASDSIRVDARDLRCKVVGEGGNLGFTQAARVEYARRGGRINADFVDNSAGVDCSDHEVNLKVLLDTAVRAGDIDADERNELLKAATDDVVAHVLRDNVVQARLLSQEERRASHRTQAAEELIVALESEGRLKRDDYGIPSSDELVERRAAGEGLSRPELAVLVAMAKSSVTTSLLEGDDFDFDDPVWSTDLERYFPATITDRVGSRVAEHPLRPQLIATLAAGEAINTLGPTFVARRAAEFGATPGAVVRAFRIAIGVCGARELSRRIDALRLDDLDVPWQLRDELNERIRVTSRWFLAHAAGGSIVDLIEEHRDGVAAIERQLSEHEVDERADERRRSWIEAGVPEDLAAAVALDGAMLLAPQMVGGAGRSGRPVGDIADAVLHIGSELQMGTLHRAVEGLPIPDRLTRWSVQALRDDLLEARVAVAEVALLAAPKKTDPVEAVDAFLAAEEVAVARFRSFLRELSDGDNERSSVAPAACTLAVRELQALGESTFEYDPAKRS